MFEIALLSVVVAAGGALPQTSDVYLLYPREILAEGLEVSEAGEYALWVCVAHNAETFVQVNDERYEFAPERAGERNEEHVWHQPDNVALTAGRNNISWGEGVSMIAFSRSPEFGPERVLGHVRALPLPEAVVDMRAVRERETNTVFTMPRYETLEAWEETAALLRKRILLGSGLYPLPEKTPLNARVFDETVYEDFAVSKVYFEAWPGFLVTGNLFRPLGEGPYPGILNPHGHWGDGRLEESERCSVVARCITLARMGAVAFAIDMIGYVDSRQTSHGWGGRRENLWGVHTFGMQLWATIRALDFLETLPYVDKERLGCTGASGGGTQTFILTAIDERVRVSSPVNMISSTMQGGCSCENAPILRLDNSNMEIGALAAPRPLLLVSTTGDWTRETPRVEYPAIRSIYQLYGAEDVIENAHFDYGHNYNLSSREAMYRFFGQHLIDGDWEDFSEPPYEPLPEDVLRVFPGEDPPEGYLHGDALIEQFIEQARERRADRVPDSVEAAAAWRETTPNVFAALLGAETPHPNEVCATRHGIDQFGEYVVERWVFGRAVQGDRIPALLYRNNEADPQDAAILVHGRGKAFFADMAAQKPDALVMSLLEQGKAVLLIDVFLTGEHHPPDSERTYQNIMGYHDTFHPTDVGHRVQDILTALGFLRLRYDITPLVEIIGAEEAGLWCLLAGAVEPAFRRIVADMNQFDMTDDAAWVHTAYIPAIRAIGDIPAAVAAGDPRRFVLYNALPSEELDALGIYVTTSTEMPPL